MVKSAVPISPLFIERLDTPTGRMLVVTDKEERVRAVDWEDCRPRIDLLLRRHCGADAGQLRKCLAPTAASRALQRYFAGEWSAIDSIPIATNGTPFQQSVWRTLRSIAPGQPISYATLAARIGQPNAIRAVGRANGSNPISIIVPCHRLIGSDASLTGYGGGIERKRWLLAHEASA